MKVDLSNTSCSAWASRSCCTRDTAKHISRNASDGTWLNFDWDHCGDKLPLSPKCRKHFVDDLCFYECSPNTGPWIISDLRTIRKERFFSVPLCRSECDAWFEDCQGDFTCTDNWAKNFVWTQGKNSCPNGSQCRTFKDIFGTSKRFCETVFDGSFKYADDTQPCMKLSFDGVNGNPNEAVEKQEIRNRAYLDAYTGGVRRWIQLELPYS
ncbi:putative Folate receptor gamma [Hypsibius exemplaris]|uniref:Folate receptor gamma n=1 Tax=Hypsibius exemplaris TaxID=2072580 RepID=A0A1W0X2G5_HYPEX|nr:putative Folate receptor gamma [Hypsibius exemplaris]